MDVGRLTVAYRWAGAIVDGEIQVDGARALGYLGAEPLPDGPIRTGDLGHVDADGFVHVTGRRKNVFITAFGRNVSPEWVESELLSHPDLAQAAAKKTPAGHAGVFSLNQAQ